MLQLYTSCRSVRGLPVNAVSFRSFHVPLEANFHDAYRERGDNIKPDYNIGAGRVADITIGGHDYNANANGGVYHVPSTAEPAPNITSTWLCVCVGRNWLLIGV